MLMELVYRLATEETLRSSKPSATTSSSPSPPWPSPMAATATSTGITSFKINEVGENDSMGNPPYWGKYIYHDNNRDINYSQMELVGSAC